MQNNDKPQEWPTEQEALANLQAVLELCAAGQVKCSEKTHRPSAATIRTVTAHLAHGDFYPDEPIAAFAWPLLLQAGGLAGLDGTRLRLTPKGRAALGNPPAETIRGLWQRWLTHAVIDEFSRIDQIKGQGIRNVLTAAKPRRQTVAKALATCPPGEWIEIDTLFTIMRRGNMSPTIARTDRALWRLCLQDPEYGSLGYDGFHDWTLLEGRYTLAVLFEYAGTLGLIDLDFVHPDGARDDFRDNWGGDDLDALSRYDGLLAIRLNALGTYALGLTDTYHPTAPAAAGAPPLKVLPNLDVVATGELPAADRLLLSAYAEQTADRVWTVSSTTLLTAIGTGRDLTEFTTFLTQRAEHDLPGTLTTLVKDVRRRAAQLTDLGRLRVIECADPALAALITHDRGLRALCRPIGDRHLAIAPGQEPKFRKTLLRLGYVLPS
ncbi:helicase-associated domain-containing protein [Actinokineospora auranticolor]|uniref:XPB/Ssl2-like helicase family protein n=1 Tax=Actinokineospora auranticolor TaxID=155976 RepID=A0A2S6GEZ3_9PSEU|nr:helicase-associated domain-containing protein [Actinokineospora auranticolor]PPK63802.1 XPB/Ssl2-like helicase family protein [Actinokineospora auranticolor]